MNMEPITNADVAAYLLPHEQRAWAALGRIDDNVAAATFELVLVGLIESRRAAHLLAGVA